MQIKQFYKLILLFLMLFIPLAAFANTENEPDSIELLIDKLPEIIANIKIDGINKNISPVLKEQLDVLKAKNLDIKEIEEKIALLNVDLEPIYPTNTFVLEMPQFFKWTSQAGYPSYTLKIKDTMSEIFSQTVKTTEYKMPEKQQLFKRGKFYFWTVEPQKEQHSFSPHVYFYVASEKEINDINKVVELLQLALKDSNQDIKDILQASFYDSKGFYVKAEALYTKVLEHTNVPRIKEKMKLYLMNLYAKSERPLQAKRVYGTITAKEKQ